MLEEREKQALRSAMIEERSRFCTLFTLLKPVMVNRKIPLRFPNTGRSSLKDFRQFPCGCRGGISSLFFCYFRSIKFMIYYFNRNWKFHLHRK
jgi:hypothetical protein